MLSLGDGIAVASICAATAASLVTWIVRRSSNKNNGECSLQQLNECRKWQDAIKEQISSLKLEMSEHLHAVKIDVNTVQIRLEKVVELLKKP